MSETTGLLTAMLAVQSEAPTLKKDRTVTVKSQRTGAEYSYSYTPLDRIKETIGPLLTKNGLVWTTRPSNNPASGAPMLKYKLAHAPSGESIEDQMDLVIDPDHAGDVQALGSSITYTRRYALVSVLDLVADADDDGAGAGGGQSRAQDRVCPTCGAAAIIKGKEEYGGGWVCFKKKGGCGAKFASDPAEPPDERADLIREVKRLVRRDNIKTRDLRVLLNGAGVEAGSNVLDAVDALTAAQAMLIVETIDQGAIPTGKSDVPPPADGEFTHEPAGESLFEDPETVDPLAGIEAPQ